MFQRGVVRTNCMDNLDRTNVVQSLFARRAALRAVALAHPEIAISPKSALDSGLPEFELAFKDAWGENADAVSMAYAGTPALKADFTKLGRRTKLGMLNDARHSMTRYVLNNFLDGDRHDAMEALLHPEDACRRLLDLARRGEIGPSASQRRVSVVVRTALACGSLCVLAAWLSSSGGVGRERERERGSSLRTAMVFAWVGVSAAVGWALRKSAPASVSQFLVQRPKLKLT